jgi:hypothetical protein
MNWEDVGSKIADMAPMLGTVLGGPVGSGFGSIVANVFGTEDSPDAVMKALQTDPNAAIKLQQIQSEERIALQRVISETSIQTITQVNSTMRAESVSEHWPQWSWRPFWGFVSALAFLVVCSFVCYLAYQAIFEGKPEAMAMVPQLIGAFATLFAIPAAILGVASYHRGKAKRGV